jgi:hypothetical protein
MSPHEWAEKGDVGSFGLTPRETTECDEIIGFSTIFRSGFRSTLANDSVLKRRRVTAT